MDRSENIINCKRASLCEHHTIYGKPKFRFVWGAVTHPGVWACGGGRKDLPPVLVGVTFQVPQREPEYAWWCYIGPRPEFENELQPIREDGGQYLEQCKAVPQRITKNMVPWTETLEQFEKNTNETVMFNKLRKRVSREMQNESQAFGNFDKSEIARIRAIAKAAAHRLVLQIMDEIEQEAAKEEMEEGLSIENIRVSENTNRDINKSERPQ